MFNLVYWSNATKPYTDGELLEMLTLYREKNTRLGITGLLLYKEGAFIQALEGEEATVRALFTKIRGDPGHYQVSLLQTIPIPKRQFPDWSMGFKNLQGVDVEAFPGYTPHPDLPLNDEDVSWRKSVAMQLLATFAQDC